MRKHIVTSGMQTGGEGVLLRLSPHSAYKHSSHWQTSQTARLRQTTLRIKNREAI